MSGLIDMHMHSSASDGTLSPSELAEECFKLGLSFAVLTDHDTVDGQAEFMSGAEKLGLSAVSGVEFNVAHCRELHILGYGFDLCYAPLNEAFDHLKRERASRAGKIAAELKKNGYPISLERVFELAGGGVVGRPHIAAVLVENGYVSDIDSAFRDFLTPGGPGYVKRVMLTSAQAIGLINAARGKADLAHPGLMKGEDCPALIRRLKGEGLFGIEAYYSAHTDEQCAYFSALADEYSLAVTCGTDFHGTWRHGAAPGSERRWGREVEQTVKILLGNS